MSRNNNSLSALLEGFKKFGSCPNDHTSADLPDLEKYIDSLRLQVCASIVDADTLLTEMDPDIRDGGNFRGALMVAYAITNAMERVITCAELGGRVLASKEVQS